VVLRNLRESVLTGSFDTGSANARDFDLFSLILERNALRIPCLSEMDGTWRDRRLLMPHDRVNCRTWMFFSSPDTHKFSSFLHTFQTCPEEQDSQRVMMVTVKPIFSYWAESFEIRLGNYVLLNPITSNKEKEQIVRAIIRSSRLGRSLLDSNTNNVIDWISLYIAV